MDAYDTQFRLRIVATGVRVGWLLALAGAAYAALTWDRPHRTIILVLAAAAMVDSVVVWAVARARLVPERRADLLLATWNGLHVTAASAAAALDGGVSSPFLVVLFVSVAFAAVCLPPRLLGAVAAINIGALWLIYLVAGGDRDHAGPSLVVATAGLLGTVEICGHVVRDRRARSAAVEEANREVLRRLMNVVRTHDDETGGHVERMSAYCAAIARRMGYSEQDAAQLSVASALHDVGKVAVPDAILHKPGPLTAAEREQMQAHAEAGHAMLMGSAADVLQLAATIALHHHERHDGGGYPHGLAGADIPLPARIAAVADVFDALTSDRVYRPAMPLPVALDIVRAGRGTQFDPAVVDAFLAALDEIRRIHAAFQASGVGLGAIRAA